MRVLPGPTKSNQVLAWSPDGRWLVAAGSGDGVTVWDVGTNAPGQRILSAGHGGRLMQFCRATGRLFVAFQAGGFWNWNPDTGEERQYSWSKEYSLQFRSMAISGDGCEIVFYCYRYRYRSSRQRREVAGYTVTGNGTMNQIWSRPDDKCADEHSFVYHPSGNLFGLGRHTDEVLRFELMEPQSGNIIGSFAPAPATGRIAHWTLSPDGNRVAWTADQALYVQPLDSSQPPLKLPAIEDAHRRGLAWAPDGRIVAYATGTTVRLLDPDTLTEVRALDWNIGKPRAVAFNPDGLRAAVSGDGGRGWVTVFDLE
ncbi:WD40-like Beta Propeller Repeat protein [Gemmata sp. SH-PL17]|uniref:WD40 repeat domain-containing protein n=1 Tax=Gemmata sp. SH-PL17 TaxID=1630693 RepID=UPI00078B678C|nr:WD40 repeat domain-containing protein [Gemmata sp. SH-PL17]AMV29506.1 WD40-like Beta Propeller Repeat protein [Gemmata sp. SH-PL17]